MLFFDQSKITPPSDLGAACPSEKAADIGVRLELQLRPFVPEYRTTIDRATRVRNRADGAPQEPDLVDQLNSTRAASNVSWSIQICPRDLLSA